MEQSEQLPLHRTIAVVDVAGFSAPARTVVQRSDMHRGLYDLLSTAFDDSGIDLGTCTVEDRGDGAMILLPADVPRSLLADQLPARLVAGLRRHNAVRSSKAAMRLRVALHFGDVRFNQFGMVGPAINFAFRILEASEAESALRASHGVLALIASEPFYQDVILPDPAAEPESYRQIPVLVKETSAVAWLRLLDGSPIPIPIGEPEDVELGLWPSSELDRLQAWLSGVAVNQPSTLVRRAAGQAVPPAPAGADAWEVFTYLDNFNARADGVLPALAFLQLLVSQAEPPLRANLTEWINNQARRFQLPQLELTPDVEPTAPATEPVSNEVPWSSDSPSDIDLLRRDSLAQVLDKRIRQALDDEPSTSMLVHLDGAWGSGKSTVLKFLGKYLKAGKPFLVVWFDAWQQSRVSPPWWALLTTLRHQLLADRGFVGRTILRTRELFARARVSGAPFVLSVVLLVILSAGVGAFTLWLASRFSPSTAELVKLFTPALAMISFLWAGIKVASRVLLWDSARGARLFEQADSNPMRRVTVHFDWLLKQSTKPVMFFVDDLDRCREDYVVEFMDSVHTLVRDAPRSHHLPDAKSRTPAAYFVVAADGAWIRQSYETAYHTFESSVATSGGSLGYLFTDKLFQLCVPMPALGSRTQLDFLGSLLGVQPPTAVAEVRAASVAIDQAGDDEAAIVDTLGRLEPPVREAVAGQAALALASANSQRYTEHSLRKFSPLLHGNPRSIKLFLNTYSILRSIRTIEGNTVAPDTLALWSVIRVRWPSIADFLQRNPEAIDGIKDNLWCSDHFPSKLQPAAMNQDLRNVVMHPAGGPLRPDLIRQCVGAAD